jgi:hypothetical protein
MQYIAFINILWVPTILSTPYLFLDTPQLQLVNLHRKRRYFVIKLHTWFCLSYFLKTNIKLYCIYQYFMSINSFFNTVSVSRYSRPITHVWSFMTKYLRFLCKFTSWSCGVSRNRYGVERIVGTHKILINAIKCYVCLQEIW